MLPDSPEFVLTETTAEPVLARLHNLVDHPRHFILLSRLRRESSAPISFFAFLDIITAVTGILILVTLILATDIGGYSPEQAGTTQADEALNTLLRSQSQVETENARLRRLVASAAHAPAVTELTGEAAALQSEVSRLESAAAAVATRKLVRLAEQKTEAASLGVDKLREQLIAQRLVLTRAGLNNEQFRTLMLGLSPLMNLASNQLTKAQSLHGQSWLRPDAGRTGKQPMVIVVSDQGAAFTPLDNHESPSTWSASSAEREFTSFCRGRDSTSQYIVFLIRPSGVELFSDLVEVARRRGLDVGYDAIAEDLVIHVGPLPAGVSPVGDGTDPSGNGSKPQTTSPPTDNQPAASSSQPTTAGAPVARPVPPVTPAQPKSWWERLVEYVKEVLGDTPS